MKQRLRALLVLPPLLLALTGCGLTASSRSPGYADVGVPQRADLHRDTSISIGPGLLGFAVRHADEDPQTMALLRALDGVRVKVYRIDARADFDAIGEDLNRSAKKLTREDWQPVMRVVEDDKKVHVFVKESGEHMVGLALMTADAEEYVFVNIMGRLTAAMIEELSETYAEEALALRADDY